METLENYLYKKTPVTELLLNDQILFDDFLLGILSSTLLSTPSIETAKLLLSLIQKLEPSKTRRVLLIFLEILTKTLHNTHKQEEIALIFESSADLALKTADTLVITKLLELFEGLQERVSCETGLRLYHFGITKPEFSSIIHDLTAEDLKNLDVSAPQEPKNRFSAVIKAYSISQKSQKYSVLNLLAFRCIMHVLRYEISELDLYFEKIEENIKNFTNQFTYEQRLKISKLYQDIANSIPVEKKKFVNGALVRQLEELMFCDKNCIDPYNLDFIYLVEDILQFDLSDQVIRDRIKSLHGKYKGKTFAGEILAALKAVKDDEPGYKAMDRITPVLKPLKLLSKNEYKRYKRNEKKIEGVEKAENQSFFVNQPNYENLEKTEAYLQTFTLEDKPQINEFLGTLINTIKDLRFTAEIQVFGSYFAEFWATGSNIDLNIVTTNKVDTYSFILALKVKLSQLGTGKIINSKRLPMIQFTPTNQSVSFNITVNNLKGKEGTDFLIKYSNLSEKINDLAKFVKLWAKKLDLNNSKSGTPSGYEWTLLVFGFLQNLKILKPDDSYSNDPVEINQSVSQLFLMFLYFCYSLNGKIVDLKTGTLRDGDGKSLFGVVNPIDGKEFQSKIKINRKQGKQAISKLADTIYELS